MNDVIPMLVFWRIRVEEYRSKGNIERLTEKSSGFTVDRFATRRDREHIVLRACTCRELGVLQFCSKSRFKVSESRLGEVHAAGEGCPVEICMLDEGRSAEARAAGEGCPVEIGTLVEGRFAEVRLMGEYRLGEVHDAGEGRSAEVHTAGESRFAEVYTAGEGCSAEARRVGEFRSAEVCVAGENRLDEGCSAGEGRLAEVRVNIDFCTREITLLNCDGIEGIEDRCSAEIEIKVTPFS